LTAEKHIGAKGGEGKGKNGSGGKNWVRARERLKKGREAKLRVTLKRVEPREKSTNRRHSRGYWGGGGGGLGGLKIGKRRQKTQT